MTKFFLGPFYNFGAARGTHRQKNKTKFDYLKIREFVLIVFVLLPSPLLKRERTFGSYTFEEIF